MSLGMEVPSAKATLCSMGTQLYTSRKKGTPTPTQFLAQVCCGQTAGWIKLALGTEVNVGAGDVVLDGGRSSLLKGAQHPSFRFMSSVAERRDGSRCHLVRT